MFTFKKPYSTYKRPIFKRTPDMKNRIWNKTKGHCSYCGCELLPFGKEKTSFTIDHVLALRNGGNNSDENLIPACYSCNSSKSHRW